MKTLVCLSVAIASIAILQAGDLAVDGALMKILSNLQTPHSEQGSNESFNTDNPFIHAEVPPPPPANPVVTVPADAVVEPVSALAPKPPKSAEILNDVSAPDPARDEWGRQNSVSDMRYGAMSDSALNGDPDLNKAPLDKELSNSNQRGAEMFDKAQPAAPSVQ